MHCRVPEAVECLEGEGTLHSDTGTIGICNRPLDGHEGESSFGNPCRSDVCTHEYVTDIHALHSQRYSDDRRGLEGHHESFPSQAGDPPTFQPQKCLDLGGFVQTPAIQPQKCLDDGCSDQMTIDSCTADPPGKGELTSKYEQLATLGVDLTETLRCRTREECDELVNWMTKPLILETISKDGKLDFSQPPHHDVMCSIETISDAPFKAHPIKANPFEKEEILRQVEEKLNQGIIEQSSAPWSSNCVCISKNGKTRIAVDYRKLNKVTKKDNYLLPTIQEILDSLEGTQWFTSIDACQAYHQIPMASERDRDLTTFVVPGGGLYRYKYMPFGLTNAGAVWTRFIDSVLSGLRWNVCLVYADDILINTKSLRVTDHIRDLDKVFTRLHRYNIKVKADKIRLALRELPFLGQLVGENGVRPDPEKTKAITALQIPHNVHELRRAMGMFTYYRKYIPDFARIAAPLYNMCGKNAQHKREKNRAIVLDDVAMESFETLKKFLATEPIMLHYPQWDVPFTVHCDASNIGLGAKLSQTVDKVERVVMYASKALTPQEKKYFAYEKEALGLVWSLELFRHYLKFQPFKVITDCRSLVYLKDKATNARVGRWMLRLQEFEFTIKHKAGALLTDVDPLSRSPLNDTNPYQMEDLEDLYDAGNREDEGKHIFGAARDALMGIEPNVGSTALHLLSEKSNPPKKLSSQMRERQGTRFFGSPDVEGWSPEDWVREQNNPVNKDVSRLFGYLKDHPDSERFRILENKILVKRDRRVSDNGEVTYVERTVVPESLRAFVLRLHHNLPLHAHQGGKRLHKMLVSRFYWPGMHRDVKQWVRSCLSCSRRKASRNWNLGLTEPTHAQHPFQVVGIDLVGKCLETSQGYKWILTIVDHFTRWPIAIPLPDRKATTIANALLTHLICEHGVPRKILSDQGQELIGSALSYLYKRWGIKPARTGGYNPQANGACERFHRWLNVSMTQLYDRKSPNWDEYLPALCFAYRASANDATGYSPYYLLRGFEPVLPSDIIFTPTPEDTKSITPNEHIERIAENLRKAFEVARRNQYNNYVAQRERGEARIKPNLNPGDKVLVWKKTADEERLAISGDKRALPGKWRNLWAGPATFIREISNTMCEVDLGGKLTAFNYNRLTKFTPWDIDHESTHVWASNLDPTTRDKLTPALELEGEDIPLEAGELILFKLEINTHADINYGIARIISITNDGYLHFQWFGNYTNDLNGKFKPGWINKQHREYYQRRPLHKSHIPFTGASTKTFLRINSDITREKDMKILTGTHHLSQDAIAKIESF